MTTHMDDDERIFDLFRIVATVGYNTKYEKNVIYTYVYMHTHVLFFLFLQRKHHLCPEDWRMFLLFKEKMLCLPVN